MTSENKTSFQHENSPHVPEGNMLIHGDNLEALKALLPKYEGKIDCIYIDPPYNTGNEGWVYNDNVNDPRIKKWLGEVVGKESEDFTRHDKWLCMMYPRLKLLHKLLSEKGAIFISIDDNEQANLKLICDEIFGSGNFVANIPWRKRTAKSDVPFGISQDYESILCYAKSDLFKGSIKGKERKYFETDDFPGKPWRFHDLTKQTTIEERPNSNFTIVNPKNGDEYPVNPLRSWAITKETFKEYYDANRIIFPGDYDFLNISKPVLRYWQEDDMKKAGDEYGLTAATTFLPPEVGMTQDGTKEITEIFGNKIFSFPKPSSLIEHLLNIAVGTNKNAIILDSFAGSGTTAHAVLNMNRKDGGNRSFILIEMMDYAESITAERVKRVICSHREEASHSEALAEESIDISHSLNMTSSQDATNAKGYIYMVTNKNKTTLYIGVTSNLKKRIYEHKNHVVEGFTDKYNCENLVYFECFHDIKDAIEREKYLKGKKREFKNNLVNSINPKWLDLYDYLFRDVSPTLNMTESFSFYELGEPLLIKGLLNEKVDIQNIREYVWFTETHSKLQSEKTNDNEYYLGKHNEAGYWFFYKRNEETCLNYEFLSTMKTKADQYIVYADVCRLPENFLKEHNIIFKKIPREIQKF